MNLDAELFCGLSIDATFVCDISTGVAIAVYL